MSLDSYMHTFNWLNPFYQVERLIKVTVFFFFFSEVYLFIYFLLPLTFFLSHVWYHNAISFALSFSLHRPLPSAILYSLYLSIKANPTSHKLFPLSPQTHTQSQTYLFHPWLTPTPIFSLPHPSSVSITISHLQTLLRTLPMSTTTSSTTPKPATPLFSTTTTTTTTLQLFLLFHLPLPWEKNYPSWDSVQRSKRRRRRRTCLALEPWMWRRGCTSTPKRKKMMKMPPSLLHST